MFYRFKYSRYTTNVKRGWTLTELIVVIAIVAILMALLLASIVRSRAAARNLQCQNSLRQIGLAFANYESAKGILPPSNDEEGNSFYVSILPWLEAKETYELVKAKNNSPTDCRYSGAQTIPIASTNLTPSAKSPNSFRISHALEKT